MTKEPLDEDAFAALMAPLGPFEPAPRLAVAVSGGADSLALALLAQAWAAGRGGSIHALIVDHRLRPESAAEAEAAAAKLQARGIKASVMHLRDLRPGPGQAERARTARYACLVSACRNEGIVHLLLGHHAADQAETILMRAASGSGPAGLAGMASVSEWQSLRVIRPLLSVPPARLRATLGAAGMDWAEDPSNADPRATRVRFRILLDDPDGCGAVTTALVEAARAFAIERASSEKKTADWLAEHVALYPQGFAVLPGGPLPAPALAALVGTIAGAIYPARGAALAKLAASPRPATLAGVRLLPAGRLWPNRLLMFREAAAMDGPVTARSGAVWDRRFRLIGCPPTSASTMLGGLGGWAAELRRVSPLPAAVLHSLPAVCDADGRPISVPHLEWPDAETAAQWRLLFAPPRPLAGAPHWPG